MKFDISSAVAYASRMVSKIGFKANQHSPEILMVVGTVSIVTGVVKACQATLKMPDIAEHAAEQIDDIHARAESVDEPENDTTSKELTTVYIHTAVKIAKIYAFPAFLIGGGIACMYGSHHIMSKRNAEAVAAYTAVTNAFAEYKNRVKERFGDEVQKEIENGVKTIEVETGELDENGNPKKEVVRVKDKDAKDPYEFLFDECVDTWQPSRDYNRMWLKHAQNTANIRLKKKGYLFLNEVLELIGFNHGTTIGQFAGWVYDPTNPNIDSFVDFGMYDLDDPTKVAFLEGDERNIWLHFNVDGNIINKIKVFE